VNGHLVRVSLVLALACPAAALSSCGEDPRPVDPLAGVKAPRLPAVAGEARSFDVRPVARGLVRPTWVGAAPGDPRALWVLEQSGRVVRIVAGRRKTLIDLRGEVRVGAEQGLLAGAFHPDFVRNRRLVLHFTNRRGDTRVVEFRLPRAGGRPRRRLLLAERQPEENHNGGTVVFGPDGDLYLGLGDGGGAFDPRRHAQNPRSRLGKILRADVDTARRPRWRPVVMGLRNPWRFSFDIALNELWIGDVGQDAAEEIDRVALELDEPPKNLGWGPFEGTVRVRRGGDRLHRPGELVWPVTAYRHTRGRCSVTAGLVYRGSAIPALAGRYVFGDFCSGELWTLKPKPGKGAADLRSERAKVPQLTHIGADERGELLLAASSGVVYRAVAARGR
jgi:glucose/arabinose dehydrogenase